MDEAELMTRPPARRLLVASLATLVGLAPGPVSQEGPGSRGFDRALALEPEGAPSASISIGDIDGDGHLDIFLVKGRHWPYQDLVLLGAGDGTFEPPYPVREEADRTYSGLLVDMDRDGDLDIVVSNDRPDPKIVYLNDGTGGFTVDSTFGHPEWSTRYVGVADLNGDALPDVVLANRSGDDSGMSYLCFGVAGGRFDDACTGVAPGSATTITPADIDGDGDLDLVVPHRDGGQSRIYLNDGAGGFPDQRLFGPPSAAYRAAQPVDLDNDGILDLVAIDERSGPVTFAGRADGNYGDAEPLGEPGLHPYALAVGDLDGNGRADVVVGYIESHPVIFFNDGSDGLISVPFGDDQGDAYGFALGDLDEDGYLDIAMARSGAPNMLYFGAPRGDVRPERP
jgi:hypothetical protein